MHRHCKHWDDPDSFDPDRFLPERFGNNPAYLPFGTGPRMCIAAQFALAEIAVVVARLLAELELEPAGPEPEVTLQITTRSTSGLSVSARRRG
jgi:cytochrome P450